jgi:hypothetical protein
MPYGIVNTDTVRDSNGGILAPISSVFRNRLINGAMVIDQRNAGASVTPTSGQYLIDRWVVSISQASKFSVQQNAGSVTPPTGFTNYLGVTSLSAYAITATDEFDVFQYIEGFNIADLGWGTANAKTITLSFQVYSSLTGTFGGSLLNNGQTRTYPFSYSIPTANTWTTISITIAGDTTGTWLTNNGRGIRVNFGLGVGSTYSGTAGAWSSNNYLSATGATSVVGTSGATFYITGVQLEVGSSATGFEYVNYQTSLANCQRYFEYQTYYGTGWCISASNFKVGFNWQVPKRTTPSNTFVSGFYQYGPGGQQNLSSLASVPGQSSVGAIYEFSTPGGMNANEGVVSGFSIKIDAEL